MTYEYQPTMIEDGMYYQYFFISSTTTYIKGQHLGFLSVDGALYCLQYEKLEKKRKQK